MGYTHGIPWNDDLIKENIMIVVEKLNLDHFPTHSEMIEVFGNKSLACKIAKHKGTVYWAEKLGLPLKYSDTTFGNKYEIKAISDIYENVELNSVQTSSRHPYDLLTDNSVKIDVKVSKEFTNNCNSKAFAFNLEKKNPTCDIFLLYCLNDDETYRKVLIIPSCSVIGKTQIGVGENSKWNRYENRWEIVKQYSEFFGRYKYQKDVI